MYLPVISEVIVAIFAAWDCSTLSWVNLCVNLLRILGHYFMQHSYTLAAFAFRLMLLPCFYCIIVMLGGLTDHCNGPLQSNINFSVWLAFSGLGHCLYTLNILTIYSHCHPNILLPYIGDVVVVICYHCAQMQGYTSGFMHMVSPFVLLSFFTNAIIYQWFYGYLPSFCYNYVIYFIADRSFLFIKLDLSGIYKSCW